jgi:multidrug efflux pump subunit AcrA (membrane-fusion protein)
MSIRRTALILGATLTLGAASIGSAVLWQGRDHPRFSTVPVTRGDLRSTVSATGTLNAVVTVPVGTQVSGTIQQVWVLQGEQPVRRWVQTGLSDGERTEVVAGLQAGDSVIVGPAAPARAGAGTSSGPRLGSR